MNFAFSFYSFFMYYEGRKWIFVVVTKKREIIFFFVDILIKFSVK